MPNERMLQHQHQHPPPSSVVVVVDGSQWDLSNLTTSNIESCCSRQSQHHQNDVVDDERGCLYYWNDDDTHSQPSLNDASSYSMTSSSRSSTSRGQLSQRRPSSDASEPMRFDASLYPCIDDIPEVLDVVDIFQKLKANNLIKMGRVANSHLSSRSTAELEEAKRRKDEQLSGVDRHGKSRSPMRGSPPSYSSELSSSTRQEQTSPQHHAVTSSTSSASVGSNTHRRERRRERLRAVDRQRYDQHVYHSSSSHSASSYSSSSSPTGPQQREHSPSDILSPQSQYEKGRQQAYQRQPLYRVVGEIEEEDEEEVVEELSADEGYDDEEDRMLVEVTPGNYVPLRGSAEIWDAVLNDNAVECMCYGCTLQLVTVQDADMIMCVACHTVSPCEGGGSGGGLGLGMKKDDAIYERSRFEETRRTLSSTPSSSAYR